MEKLNEGNQASAIIQDLNERPAFVQEMLDELDKPEPPISETQFLYAKDDFKKKLRLSQKFFELCLDNEADFLSTNAIEDIFAIFGIKPKHVTNKYEYAATLFLRSNQPFFSFFNWYGFYYDLIFKVCVIGDILDGYKNNEAIGYAQEIDERLKKIHQLDLLLKK